MPRFLKITLLVTAATLLLCFLAFYNGFPLLYPDTGTYIHSGFTGQLPIDRPIFYGMFLRHASLAASPWLVILVQSAILAWLLLITLRRFVSERRIAYYYVFTVLFLIYTTGISYYANLLIPDIFTPILFLSAFNLAFFTELTWSQRIPLAMLLMLALSTHLSNLPTIVVAMMGCALLGWIRRKRSKVPFKGKSLAIVAGLVAITYLLIPGFNALKDGHFRYTAGSSIFMANRLRDLDLVKRFLDEDCPNHDWKLCPYKGELYGDFLWDAANSPLYKTGGWEANFEEYSNMNRQILLRPSLLSSYARACFEDGSRQFFVFETGPAGAFPEASPPVENLKTFFPSSARACLGAKQIKGQLDFTALNGRQEMVVFVSWGLLLLVAMAGSRFQRLPADLRWFLIWLLSFSVVNCFICASLAMVDPRYQGRMVWLFPFAALMVIFVYLERYEIPERAKRWLKGKHILQDSESED